MYQGHVALLESFCGVFKTQSWYWDGAKAESPPLKRNIFPFFLGLTGCEASCCTRLWNDEFLTDVQSTQTEARGKKKGESGEGFINCEVADLPVGPCQVQLLQFFLFFIYFFSTCITSPWLKVNSSSSSSGLSTTLWPFVWMAKRRFLNAQSSTEVQNQEGEFSKSPH